MIEISSINYRDFKLKSIPFAVMSLDASVEELSQGGYFNFTQDHDDLDNYHLAAAKVNGKTVFFSKYANGVMALKIDSAEKEDYPVLETAYMVLDEIGVPKTRVMWVNENFQSS